MKIVSVIVLSGLMSTQAQAFEKSSVKKQLRLPSALTSSEVPEIKYVWCKSVNEKSQKVALQNEAMYHRGSFKTVGGNVDVILGRMDDLFLSVEAPEAVATAYGRSESGVAITLDAKGMKEKVDVSCAKNKID